MIFKIFYKLPMLNKDKDPVQRLIVDYPDAESLEDFMADISRRGYAVITKMYTDNQYNLTARGTMALLFSHLGSVQPWDAEVERRDREDAQERKREREGAASNGLRSYRGY